MALPTFFLAGAPKAGTTSLYRYLGTHPDIYVSPVKEPGFFASAELLAWESPAMKTAVRRNAAALEAYVAGDMREELDPGLALDWHTYTALFRNVRHERAIGEGSVVYSWAPSAPAAIHARLPMAKFIFVLRDPAERFFSQCLAAMWAGPHRTVRDRFRAAQAREGEWGPTLDAGRYATNLERFLARFPRDQMRIYRYEQLRSEPHALLRDAFEFLGVRPDHVVDVAERRNEPVVPRWPRLHAARRAVFGNRSMTAWLPSSARGALQRRYRGTRVEMQLEPGDRRMLVDYYRDEIRRTADLLDWELSAWLR
jgi:hypothetical protein